MQSLVVAGTTDSLDQVSQYVLDAVSEVGLSGKKAYGLRLAVDEIATNIVMHGYAEAGRQGDLICSTRVTSQELQICLEDTGVPFDPRNVYPQKPTLTHQIMKRGLGIFLALNYVDDFLYEHDQGVNRSIFVVKRNY